jgi:hypothetical protein
VAVVGAVVAGCGSGPGQVGSAAIVGSTVVPLSQVQSQLDGALAKPDLVAGYRSGGQGGDQIARDILVAGIMHDLVGRAAATEGLVVTDAQIDQVIAAQGGVDKLVARTPYDATTLRDGVRDELLTIELARRYIDRLAVSFQAAEVDSQAEAEAKGRIAAAGGPAADALFAGPPRQAPAAAVLQLIAQQPDPVGLVILGTPAGHVALLRPPTGQTSWLVLRIVGRSTDGPVSAQPMAGQFDNATLLQFGRQLLQPVAEQAGVRVNPRYGVWDQLQMAVVPTGQEFGSVITPPVG